MGMAEPMVAPSCLEPDMEEQVRCSLVYWVNDPQQRAREPANDASV